MWNDANHVRVGVTSSDVSAPGTVVLTLSDPSSKSEFASAPVSILPPSVDWSLLSFGPWNISREVQLLLLVLFTGVFGSSVYSLKSLGDYRGDNRLFESWLTFYVIQPFTGMGIAFLLYVVIRAGFLAGAGSDSSGVNQFGICAIAGLAGAFSDTAFLKLREVFQTLFKPQDDRSGKIGPKITTTSLPDGTVWVVYSQTLKATGGVAPLKWSVTPTLPAPLTLDPALGVIEGTPTSVLTKTRFTFTVTDSAAPAVSASVDLMLEIKAAADAKVTALRIGTTALVSGTVGSPYNQKLQTSGGILPLRWSVNPTLPTGLVLDAATGTISGTTTIAIKSQFTFTVSDGATPPASASADLELEIKSVSALQITTTSLPDGIIGTAYDQQLQSSGGVTPLRWSVSPILPTGLSLDPATGAISGSPTTPAAKSLFKFTVSDPAASPAAASVNLALEIKEGAAAKSEHG